VEKLLIIQPVLTKYRLPVYAEIALSFETTIISSSSDTKSGFGNADINNTAIKEHIHLKLRKIFGGIFFYQIGILKVLKKIKPDKIYACAATHDLGFWLLLFYCSFIGIPVYSNSQGPFNKTNNLLLYKFIYSVITKFSTRLILYTPYSFEVLKKIGISTGKMRIAHNTIENSTPVDPHFKNFHNTLGVLFIGRLREETNIELLFDAVEKISNEGVKLDCHIIGSGVKESYYKNKYKNASNFHWYGQLYDENAIAEISKMCFVACYPGNVGLSVVHYMSLGLPVIIHNNITLHQGPESTYVIDNYNGFLFDYNNQLNSLHQVLQSVLNQNPHMIKQVGINAYSTYVELKTPSYASKIISIISEQE